jgi:hypothetical protein
MAAGPGTGLVWTPQGPRPSTRGQVEGIADGEVVGAIQALAPHPTDTNVLFVGAVNGGIWRTGNALAARPGWTVCTDRQLSLSIGALEYDPTDANNRTLVAGTGRGSSLRGTGGALLGLLRTTDNGTSWTVIDGGGQLRNKQVTGLAARGNTIIVATTGGVFRTSALTTGWTKLSGTAGTGLPLGAAFDLAGDPADRARLFTHAGPAGIFRSTDTGATWSKVSTAPVDSVLQTGPANVRISVGAGGAVYVAIAVLNQLAGIFRSGDGGASWTVLDLPRTREGGGFSFGLHPGRQAAKHLSLAADRSNANLAYIGGDRQPGSNEQSGTGPTWPNSLGARDYSGRLFCVDAGKPAGSQARALTHAGTASNSAPHADSRDMAIAANGQLFEADDGGVYRRTSPRDATGDWFSMNGDLQVTEFHAGAWDSSTRSVIGGAQDTGTPQQAASAAARWASVATGDGGVVLVDAVTTPGSSTRYFSYHQLRNFRRAVYRAGVHQSTVAVPLRPLGGAQRVQPQFYTPLELNRVRPVRLVIGAANGVYESGDQADTVSAIGPGIVVNDTGPIAYGATGNADLLWVGSGNRVFVRTAAPPAPLTMSGTYPGAKVVGIAVPLAEPRTACVVDATRVFRTTDAGAHWQEITGNLMGLGPVALRSVTFCERLGGGAVVVGSNAGVFMAAGPGFATWSRLGADLPAVPVMRLQYSAVDRVLLAVTLGRGAWTLAIP